MRAELRGVLVWTLFVASAGGFTSCSSDPAPPAAECIAESDHEMCARLALGCGLFVGFDTCGRQRTINCGVCASPLICGGSGVPNVCAPSGSGTGGSGGEGDGSAGTDGSADAAADANPCTFSCPTLSHWLAGTFTFNSATPRSTSSTGVLLSTGALLPLVAQTVSLMISFDQGAEFKDPPESNKYRLRILTTPNDLLSSGDTSGVFETRIVPRVDGSNGELWFEFGTQQGFTASFARLSDLAFRIQIRCSSVSGLSVGPDQYLIPGPIDCPKASISVVEGDSLVSDLAQGSGTFSYR